MDSADNMLQSISHADAITPSIGITNLLDNRSCPGWLSGMFERYSERARQTVFFARHEAARLSSSYIQSHHLLLGTLRADAEWAARLFASHTKIEALRERFARPADAPRVSASVDLPLDAE